LYDDSDHDHMTFAIRNKSSGKDPTHAVRLLIWFCDRLACVGICTKNSGGALCFCDYGLLLAVTEALFPAGQWSSGILRS